MVCMMAPDSAGMSVLVKINLGVIYQYRRLQKLIEMILLFRLMWPSC